LSTPTAISLDQALKEQRAINDAERRNATSASNAAADSLCAGRFLAQKNCPESKSDDAATGTKIHEALAKQDPAGLDLAETEMYDACRKIEEAVCRKVFGTNYEKCKVWRELRVWGKVPTLTANRQGQPATYFDHSGKLDCFYRYELSAVVIEYKTGNNQAPSSPKNEQIRDQIVLLARQPANLLEGVVGVVIQPLVTHDPEFVLYLPRDIDEAEQRMFARVRASNDPASPRTPNDISCKFCLAKSRCLEWQKWSGFLVPQMTSLLDVPVESWTPDQRGQFLDKRKVAQDWLDNAEAAIKAGLAADPAFATGWTLKPGAIQHPITDAQECFTRFMALEPKAQTPEDFTARTKVFMAAVKVVSGKLEEGVNKVTSAKGKALKSQMSNLLDGITEEKQNAPSLKKVSEP
jgi:hypothetical protein